MRWEEQEKREHVPENSAIIPKERPLLRDTVLGSEHKYINKYVSVFHTILLV